MSLVSVTMLNGVPVDQHPLARAVVISLFTWRHADASDVIDGIERYGWWGDSFPSFPGDRIGSKLWLLAREVMTGDVLARAEQYAKDALAWMVDDQVASAVTVKCVRTGLVAVALIVTLSIADGDLELRFDDLWGVMRRV